MRLVNSVSGNEVRVGDALAYRSEPTKIGYVSYIEKPKHGGSTGRIYVTETPSGGNECGYYPNVFDCKWIEREDQA